MRALTATDLNSPAADPGLWPLDQTISFLNHGSFGSCPREVLEVQREFRDRLERQPIQFLVRDLEALWDDARAVLATFVGARHEDVVFVPNATTGVNAVLRSVPFESGDELLVTNHEYNACRNVADYIASSRGIRVVVAEVPFPVQNEDQFIEPVLRAITSRTRLALLDHVTSQTGLVFPVQRLVRLLAERGIDALIDGAHAPGMVPLNLQEIGAAYYTGNCHKWICAPKGAAFLHVARDRQQLIRPLVISHGANSVRHDRSRFLIEFGWMGTGDPSAMLSVPAALKFMENLGRQLSTSAKEMMPASLAPLGERVPVRAGEGVSPGAHDIESKSPASAGWSAVMRRNHELAVAARSLLCEQLKIKPPCPPEFLGSLASVPIPDALDSIPSKSPLYLDPLQDKLLNEHSVEVPIIPWPRPPHRLLRISAQLYNSLPQYERLTRALVPMLVA